MNLLSVKDLEVGYATKTGLSPAVRGISFEVAAGEKVALVGESGSGKSTTAHAIINLLSPAASITGGSISFQGRALLELPARAWPSLRGRHVGLVPQDPAAALNPTMRIGAQVAEALRLVTKVPRRVAQDQAITLLGEVGLDRPEFRARQYPHELSGGMRQRVLIAIAIAGKPALIIADEPTSALDVSVQRTILDLLDQVAAQNNSAVLLITHDLAVAGDRADRLIVMNQGKIEEQGQTTEILHNPQTRYTRQLLAAAPILGTEYVASRAPAEGSAQAPLITVSNLSKRFRLTGSDQHVQAVDAVNFEIQSGTTFALVGESGSGKSTITRLLMGLTKPDTGTVTFDGVDVTASKGNEKAVTDLRSHTGFVYQNPFGSLNPRLTVGRIIEEPLLACKTHKREPALRQRRVQELLEQVRLEPDFATRHPAALSGGQRQRVAIARALARSPKFLVLDEPTSALDVSVQKQVLDLLMELQQASGLTYLFVTHDLAVVAQIADRVGVMQGGKLVEVGSTQQVFEDPRSEYTRQLLAAVPGQSQLVK